jgi:hypothetical protein
MQVVMWQQPNRPRHHAHHGRQGCLIIEQAFAPEIVMPSSWKIAFFTMQTPLHLQLHTETYHCDPIAVIIL